MGKRLLSGILCAVMCLGFCVLPGCGEEQQTAATVPHTVLSYGCTGFSGNFSPFFAVADSDREVVELTQLWLLNTDRAGNVICNGIDGETAVYNGMEYSYTGPADVTVSAHTDGSVEYAFTLRDDLTFSDGTALTAKDVVFSMYVLCDPTYNGTSSFSSLPIKGLKEYRRNVIPKWQLILEATPANATNGSSEGYYTAAEAIEFWTLFNEAGAEFAAEIVDDGIARGIGSDVCSVAEALGYVGLPENATTTDFFNLIVDTRSYTVSATGINASAAKHDFSALLMAKLSNTLKKGVITGTSAPRIAGIRQTGDYTLSVTLEQADVTALHQFCIPIAPLHYYGNVQQFSPESGSFGFAKGDLSGVRSKSEKPLGAGAYTYSRYRNGMVTLNANATYYRGAPKIAQILCKSIVGNQKMSSLSEGKLQITEVDMTPALVSTVEKANGGVLSGDVITVGIMDAAGYGYIGMSADRIRVGGSSESEASRSLRKALMTVFSAYRRMSVEAYYGEYGSVRPMQHGFGIDASGAPSITDDASDEIDDDRVLAAVLSYFEKAGYTVQEGRITAAPQGASLQFNVAFTGCEAGEHPAFSLLKKASDILAKIGITLTLTDYKHEEPLLADIRSGVVEIWCDFRAQAIVPDYYTSYASDGSYRVDTDISDEALDELLSAARRETDVAKREALYEKIEAVVMDWAVEVPVYQKQTVVIASTVALNIDTLVADMTPYYDWKREVEILQMKN